MKFPVHVISSVLNRIRRGLFPPSEWGGPLTRRAAVSLLVVFLLLTAGMGVAGFLYYKKQKAQARTAALYELSTIAHLKVQGIAHWREERVWDAFMNTRNPSMNQTIRSWFRNPSDAQLRDHLTRWLANLRVHREFESVSLLDAQGAVRLALPERATADAEVVGKVLSTPPGGGPTFLDFRRPGPGGKIALFLFAPVPDPDRAAGPPIGFLLLNIDPSEFLYPYIQSWPTRSPTGETMLVERQGSDVIYLNELRHKKGTALVLRRSLSDRNRIAAQAVLAGSGTTEATDYALLAVSTGALVFGAAVTLLFVAGRQIARQENRAGQAMRESEARFKAFISNVPAAAWIKDVDGRYVYANAEAEKSFSRPLQLILGNTDEGLFPPETARGFRQNDRRAMDQGSAVRTVEVMQQADGTERTMIVSKFAIPGMHGPRPEVAGVSFDISDRIRMEERLRESEERYRLVVQSLDEVVWDWDPVSDRVLWSDGIGRTFGYAEAVAGTDVAWWKSRIHPEEREQVWATLRQAVEVGDKWAAEYRFLRADGTYAFVFDRASALRRPDGSALRVIGAMIDISARKESEEELRRSEALFRQITEGLPQIVWTARPDGSVDYASESWYRYTGTTPAEVLGDQWQYSLHPEDRERTLAYWAESVRTGELIEIEYRIRGSDGSYRWFLARGLPLRDERGRVVRWFGTCTDIHDLKRLQDDFRESDERLRLSNEAAEIGTWDWDLSTNKQVWNERTRELFGLRPDEETTYERAVAGVRPDDREKLRAAVERALAGQEAYDTEYRVLRPDGSVRWVSARALVVREEARRPVRMTGVCIDITSRKEYEKAITLAREAAEAASRAKSEFLANMSHEIRTPLNGIMGVTELVLEKEDDPAQRQYLQMIKGSAVALLTVINDVLDFAKIEAGKMEFENVEFELRALVESAAEAIVFRAHQKALEVVVFVEPDLPDVHLGDPGRLRQVLLNLLGNATKFTEQGEVVVRVERSPDLVPRPNRCWLRFSVQDTGIGIPRGKQDELFESFTQVDASVRRRYGGTGLGLAISKRILDGMGGRIWFRSEEGRGSTFFFEVELETIDSHALCKVHPPVDLAGKRVLVADGNASSRKALTSLLESRGASVSEVERGLAAVERIQAACSAGRPFDLALIDEHLPDIGGFSVLERLRETISVEACTILMVTSEDVSGAARRANEMGIGAYLMKPVRPAKLLEAIEYVKGYELQKSAGRPAVTGVEPEPCETGDVQIREGVRVLLAEDNAVNRTVVEAFLGRRGVSVQSVEDGRQAVQALAGKAYDLILMDVQMPELDGYQATRELRRLGFRGPIVGLTAHAMRGDRERCMEAGMDDYIPKPVLPEELYRKVARWTGGVCETESPAPPPVDVAKLLGTLSGDRGVLRTITEQLRKTADDLLPEMERAVDGADAEALQRAAHKLKGGLLAFEAREAVQYFEKLERLGHSGTTEGGRELLDEMKPVLENLLEYLEAATQP